MSGTQVPVSGLPKSGVLILGAWVQHVNGQFRVVGQRYGEEVTGQARPHFLRVDLAPLNFSPSAFSGVEHFYG